MMPSSSLSSNVLQPDSHYRRHHHRRRRLNHEVSSVSTSSCLSMSSSAITTSMSTESTTAAQPVAPRKFVNKPFEYHQVLQLRIDSLTNMGWGVGRVTIDGENDDDRNDEQHSSKDPHDDLAATVTDGHKFGDQEEQQQQEQRQWVVMVPHVLVGELVRVRIYKNMKKYSEADLIEVIEPSQDRVEPLCSLAGVCGGCQYQHASIDFQRRWKQRHVEEVLLQQRIKGYDVPGETLVVLQTIGTDEVYGYRSKITPHYQAPREEFDDPAEGEVDAPDESRDRDNSDRDTDESITPAVRFVLDAIGFQQSSNSRLVDVPECPIATPAINDKYRETRQRLYEDANLGLLNNAPKKKKRKRRGSRNGALGATLLFRQADNDPVSNQPVVVTDHNQYMTTTVKDIKYRYQAGNFFQNNNFMLPLMIDAVVCAATEPISISNRQSVEGNGLESSRPRYLIDCYCGSGLFALSAASHFDLCVGIEVNDKAVEEATENARGNDIRNCQFVAASAEAIFTSPPELIIEGFESMKVQDFPRSQTVVVVDPPRKGCSTQFLEQLYDYSPQRIIYMSCDPATQARDTKGIVEIGGYTITSIQPVRQPL